MLILLLDTATEKAFVAVAKDGKIIFHKQLPSGYQHSKFLLPIIKEAFKSGEWTAKDFDCIGVGVGPGSYTGIRVAAAAAQSIAYGANLPLVEFCSLEGFVPKEEGMFAVASDAKIGGVYLLIGEKKGEEVIYRNKISLIRMEDLSKELEDIKLIITPLSTQLKIKIGKCIIDRSFSWIETFPDVLLITKVIIRKFNAGEVIKDGKLNLMYLRKTQAEIEKEK